jgi:hypothetical protein
MQTIGPSGAGRSATASRARPAGSTPGPPAARRSSGRPRSASASPPWPSEEVASSPSATPTTTTRSSASTPTRGTVLWRHSYESDLGDKFFEGGPTSTPTIDGNRVYSIGRWGDVFCFDAATGKVVWSVNLQKEGGFPPPCGDSAARRSSFENLLVLNVGDAGVALEKASGKIVWKSAATESGYSTPLPIKRGDETLPPDRLREVLSRGEREGPAARRGA